ncbi:MAG: mevalonate kinase [Candidatus Verstraetearchaeota archaeon]|nr:mevalonate kinase [Candidatus Verstraetearchaeota archaeon]
MRATVSVPGKVSLFGEHAIVFGEPALVAAIGKRLTISAEERSDRAVRINAMDLHVPGVILTFTEDSPELTVETDYGHMVGAVGYVREAIEAASEHLGSRLGVNITIRSEMPVGAGLGTSAAVSVGTVAAYSILAGHQLPLGEIASLAHKTELRVQNIASPMDTSVATYGGVLYIRPTSPTHIERLQVACELPFVIGYVERESRTSELVKKVRDLRESYAEIISPILQSIGRITERAKAALAEEDLPTLGRLMNINHGLLDSLGVSTKALNDMVYSARFAGAVGSKMTGAGGGGCMIALCPGKELEVSTAIKVVGGCPFRAPLSCEGLRVESVEK